MPLRGIGWKDGEMIWPRGRLLECGQNLKWRWLGEGRVQSRRLMAQSSRLVLQSSRLVAVQRVEQSTDAWHQSTDRALEATERVLDGPELIGNDLLAQAIVSISLPNSHGLVLDEL